MKGGRMLIAQISDCHLSAPDTLAYGHVDAGAALARVVAHVNAGTRPDMAMISGDLTNDGSVAEMRHAKSALDRLQCPYRVLPGNHDLRASMRTVFGAEYCPAPAGNFLNFTVELGDLRLIALDSILEGAPGGAFCDTRADWLADALGGNMTTPTLVFLHHPPLPLGVPETDEDGFLEVEKIANIVTHYPNIARICSGHIHLATQTMWHGILCVTAPSTAMELTRDFGEYGHPSRFSKPAPGYLMHHLTRAGQLVSHVVHVPQDGETYPFEPLS